MDSGATEKKSSGPIMDVRGFTIALGSGVMLGCAIMAYTWFVSNVPNIGLEFGYFGQFNKTQRVLENMKGIQIYFHEGDPSFKRKSDDFIRQIIENKIETALLEVDIPDNL
jgi:hypothetical protein